MMQKIQSHQDYTHNADESLFEIDFDNEQKVQIDEEKREQIYQELMSLEW